MKKEFEKIEHFKAKAFICILQSEKDKGIYIGSTQDLTKRFKQHSNGKVKSPKSRRPLKLIYFDEFDSYPLAFKRENI